MKYLPVSVLAGLICLSLGGCVARPTHQFALHGEFELGANAPPEAYGNLASDIAQALAPLGISCGKPFYNSEIGKTEVGCGGGWISEVGVIISSPDFYVIDRGHKESDSFRRAIDALQAFEQSKYGVKFNLTGYEPYASPL